MSAALNKVEDLWFPDGNVIIRVGDRVCRVYKGFLASQSSVLADMFSIPQPPHGEDMMHGTDVMDALPVVALPDPQEEVTHWLRAMFLPGDFEAHPTPVGSSQLLAVLRLSHKYDVQYLRRRALVHLAACFPTDVDGVQDISLNWTSQVNNIQLQGAESPVAFDARVYTVANEIGALWLVPFTVYAMHTDTWTSTYAIDDIVNSDCAISLTLVVRLYKIANLVQQHFPVGFVSGFSDSECAHDSLCKDYERRRQCDTIEALQVIPLTYYSRSSEGHHMANDICPACCRIMLEQYSDACMMFWEELPATLELPSWQDLLAIKARDLDAPRA
ncbi:hypothetical protein BD626DRAFT_466797 [Schizophyllum amplum]|uniref:BTB domain-containing protein n=1 Tax=Schizophyllum amplum TaxID=97359 RepID=A0A550BUH4_9AGAR|nr:hypothetical protein BD626DRAFT_466797 [Auriculariopsis ampla]